MSDLVLAESFLITGDKNALSSHEPSGSTAVTITIVRDVVEGKFSEVLTTTEAKGLLVQFGEGGKNDFHLSIRNSSDIIGTPEKELFALAVGVACLHSFIQINWTGPDLDFLPSSIFTSTLHISEEDLNAIAVSELAYGGEPAYHLAKAASLLRLAQLIFSLPFQFVQSSPWWSLRSKNVHQQLLDEPVALSPEYFLSLQSDEEKLKDQPADLLGRFILEEGLLRHRVGHDKIAAELFVRSARAMGLEYELTGALGKRTKFQQTDLTQLVLLAESRSRDGNAKETPAGRSEETPSASNAVPATLLLNDDTLLEQTQFTSSSTSSDTHRLSHLNPQSQPALHPLDQSILLAMCLNVKNTSPSHGLTSEQMSPYVARVISHPRNWSVHTMALLIRSRLESGRTRTVERSTLQLQALIDQMPTSDSTLDERLLYFHQLPLPSKWELERELAMRYLSLGVVRSAMEIFERLEMWEEVVKCWQSLERPEKGIAIVRDLLEGRKEESKKVTEEGKEALKPKRAMMDIARQAKLWCLLGDLEPDHAEGHYTHAWEVSNHTSARALRSLGGLHFSRGTYEKAISYLSKAVTINPLFSRTWFILGCAYVREEDWDGAKEAFGRCVGIDDEDGESWSNLASVYLRMSDKQETRTDETTINADASFSHKTLAFRALKQGLKFSYSNWRMWSNYMIVAVDVGELSEATRALGRIVEERAEKVGGESVDMDVLERVVDASIKVPSGAEGENKGDNPNEGAALMKRVEDLFTRTILPRLSSSPRIFRSYARLLLFQNRWKEAIEAHLNAYRCSIISDPRVETDLERWREAVQEVEDLVDVMRNLGPRADAALESESGKDKKRKGNWQFQAKSLVRTFMGRTKDNFGEEAEWEKLKELMEELRSD